MTRQIIDNLFRSELVYAHICELLFPIPFEQ